MQGGADTAAADVRGIHRLDSKCVLVAFLRCVDTPLASFSATIDSHPLLIILCENKVKIPFDSIIPKCILELLAVTKELFSDFH